MSSTSARAGRFKRGRAGPPDASSSAYRGAKQASIADVSGVLIACLFVASAAPALADDAKPEAPAGQPQPTETSLEPIQPPGSSDDLNDEIAKMRPRSAGLLPNGPVSLFDPIFDDFNATTEKAIGLKFGMAYTYVYQRASDSYTDDKNAMAGDADIFARCRFFGDDKSPTRGLFGVNGEYRHDFGDDVLTPKDLTANYGGLWRSVNGFGRQDLALTQCWWEQHLASDNLVVTIGKIDPDNYYNKNRYQSDSTCFLSQAFSTNPARKFPSNGLGGNVLVKLAPEWYASVGAQDANGDKQKSGFHTIDQGDFFAAVEAGWTPTFDGYGKGAYRLTFWGIEAATIAGTPSDRGVALSCEQEIGKDVVPFFRAAWSQGDATSIRSFAAGGFGLEGVLGGEKDLTGIGLSWGNPTSSAVRDQFGGEVFHRFQLAPDVQFTVGYQYVFDPSYAPASNHDPVGIFELRVRIEF